MRQARKEKDNPQPFAELHAALVPLIRNHIISLDRQLSPADCDDLIQETIFAFFQGLRDYREEASVITFALSIARHLTLKNRSKRQRSPVVYVGDLSGVLGERELWEQPASLPIELSESQAKIQQALAQLTDVQRQAIELDVIRSLPRRESLKLANCNPNQFQKMLQRGMEALWHFLRHLQCIIL